MDDTPPATYVVTQQDGATAPLRSVGAKAAALARIAREGIAVPAFFVVSSDAFALHLAAAGIEWPASAGPPGSPNGSSDPAQVPALRDRIRTAPVPDPVARQAVEAYEALCSASGRDQVAVRSSASEEDSASASFAGQFASILGVRGPVALLDAVRECWASSLSERSLRYRAGLAASAAAAAPAATHSATSGPGFGVVVQVQVPSHKAGVAFTVHPLEPGGDLSYVEANFGTGESVTSGLANPDGVTVRRSTLEIVETRIGTKRRMTTIAPDPAIGPAGPAGRGGSVVVDVDEARRQSQVLTDAEAREIAAVGLRLEQVLHGPQDVEWAFDDDGLWVLQSRPVTGPPPENQRSTETPWST